jgi:hypothetical protein
MRFLVMLVCAMMMLGCSNHMWGWHKGATPSHLGATSRETIIVHIDKSFTKEERSNLDFAIGQWNRVFNGQISIKVGAGFSGIDEGSAIVSTMRKEDQGWIIVRASSEDLELVGNVPSNVLAFAGRGIMVVIYDRFGTRDMRTVLMHEMGHLLGVGHVRSPSLMHPYYGHSQYSCIDKITVSEMAAARGLRLEELNYCSTPGFE